ncbi:MAG: AAA family ATPase [Bacteroidales bacterium]|nr:AAA family ATPase [Bacteroidales bacterium]MBN2749046.1 AAA family ATPase [Bacteroidales bacterium]
MANIQINPQNTIPQGVSLNEFETPDTINPWKTLEEVEVDPTLDIDKPPTAIEIISGNNIAPSCTLGNFSMVIGKAKSKKTFLLTGLAAAAVSGNTMLNRIKGVLPAFKNAVLYFDTEQSNYHLNRTIKRILRQSKGLANLRAFGLRKFKPAERLQLIEFALYNTPNIGLVFIDGIRDLLTKGINDEENATELTSLLLKWTAELNIHIVTVLHQNKGDQNARGHIGTEMVNKAETVLAVKVDDHNKDTSIVSCEMSRDLGFDDFAFYINDEGLPEPCEMPDTENVKPKTTNPDQLKDEQHFNVLSQVFESNTTPKYSELWKAIKVAYGSQQVRLGDNKAKDFLAYYQQKGWISKEGSAYKYNRAIF